MSDLRPNELMPLEPGSVAAFLGPNGALKDGIEAFESRPAQQEMAASVAICLNRGDRLCVEAPTGVGKSLAYLLPAALWAMLNERRVVVATRTINLQRQLVDKDLPTLARLLARDRPGKPPLKAVELVGRGNYVCPMRLDEAFSQKSLRRELDQGQQQDLWRIKAWAEQPGHEGRRQDLEDAPDLRVWDEVRADADNCSGPKCAFFDNCPFFASRRRAATANLLVVNHALLLADAVSKGGEPKAEGVLPRWDAAIVDEGHHLETEATRAFTIQVSAVQLGRQLDRLLHPRIAGAGDLGRMDIALGSIEGSLEAKAQALSNRIVEELPEWIANVRQSAERLWVALGLRYGEEGRGNQVWIDEGRRKGPEWAETTERLVELKTTLDRLLARLQTLLDDAEHHGLVEDQPFVGQAVRGLTARMARLKEMVQAIAALNEGDEDFCTWVEVGAPPEGRRRQHIAVYAAPVDVSTRLQALFFEPNWATVLTSATIAADGRFDLLLARTGMALDDEEVITLSLPSPFDHARQALLAVDTSMPDPRQDGGQPHTSALISAVDQIARRVGGGVLVLFTSFRVMNIVYEALAVGLTRAKMTPMIQARRGLSRAELLRRFRSTDRAVLFATDSFWEGIDVPGDALRCVVITRLPFSVPTEPIAMARHDLMRRAGGNPFFELTLPQAILRLRQGYGRLIRRSSDSGAVVILDPRVDTARYGRRFLNSLPPARRLRGDIGAIGDALGELFRP